MNKTYHFELPGFAGRSGEYDTIDECAENCRAACALREIDYGDPSVRFFFTRDRGKTYTECTERGVAVRQAAGQTGKS